jgi:hypothetical protein
MQQVEWEEYLNIPVASDEDIQQIEDKIGIVFPEEFRQLLKLAQGKTPIPDAIESEEVNEVGFGPVFHVLPDVKPAYSLERVKKHWDEYYPGLLPIASSAGSGCFFAYDFRQEGSNPPIVFVNAEANPEDEEENEGILFVAHNLTELLSSLKD